MDHKALVWKKKKKRERCFFSAHEDEMILGKEMSMSGGCSNKSEELHSRERTYCRLADEEEEMLGFTLFAMFFYGAALHSVYLNCEILPLDISAQMLETISITLMDFVILPYSSPLPAAQRFKWLLASFPSYA